MGKRLGVYRIYYQTEPVKGCEYRSYTVNEIWDYSWKNIDNCAKSFSAPRQRYLPPGYLGHLLKAKHSTTLLTATFFGTTEFRPCWKQIQDDFKGGIQDVYNIWSYASFNRFTKENSVFVNIAKYCSENDPVTAVRIPIW